MALADNRLTLAAELLGRAEVVADIGTDHALLPIYMVENGIADRVIACDIAAGPLSVAKENVATHGYERKISLRLADGLEGVAPGECNAVTITGMGGETIAGIIEKAEWLKTERQTLVLQPMSCDDRLRNYLNNNGFEILKEVAVYAAGRVYVLIKAVFTDCKPKTTPEYKYIGELLISKPQKAEFDFVVKRLKSMKKCFFEIESVERRQELYNELKSAVPAVEEQLATAYEKYIRQCKD